MLYQIIAVIDYTGMRPKADELTGVVGVKISLHILNFVIHPVLYRLRAKITAIVRPIMHVDPPGNVSAVSLKKKLFRRSLQGGYYIFRFRTMRKGATV
jgi:hypothetical protein